MESLAAHKCRKNNKIERQPGLSKHMPLQAPAHSGGQMFFSSLLTRHPNQA
jgi:hypothetical protein